jgi:hypothetical protein
MTAEPQEVIGFLATPGIEVTNQLFVGDKKVWVTCKYREKQNMPLLRQSKEVIGACVTNGARLKICSYLDVLKEKHPLAIQIQSCTS